MELLESRIEELLDVQRVAVENGDDFLHHATQIAFGIIITMQYRKMLSERVGGSINEGAMIEIDELSQKAGLKWTVLRRQPRQQILERFGGTIEMETLTQAWDVMQGNSKLHPEAWFGCMLVRHVPHAVGEEE